MALFPCTECGNSISTRASMCPKCGCPVMPEDVREVEARLQRTADRSERIEPSNPQSETIETPARAAGSTVSPNERHGTEVSAVRPSRRTESTTPHEAATRSVRSHPASHVWDLPDAVHGRDGTADIEVPADPQRNGEHDDLLFSALDAGSKSPPGKFVAGGRTPKPRAGGMATSRATARLADTFAVFTSDAHGEPQNTRPRGRWWFTHLLLLIALLLGAAWTALRIDLRIANGPGWESVRTRAEFYLDACAGILTLAPVYLPSPTDGRPLLGRLHDLHWLSSVAQQFIREDGLAYAALAAAALAIVASPGFFTNSRSAGRRRGSVGVGGERVFLCYNHNNLRQALALRDEMTRAGMECILLDQLLSVRDQRHLSRLLRQRLRASHSMIVLLTPESMKANWSGFERVVAASGFESIIFLRDRVNYARALLRAFVAPIGRSFHVGDGAAVRRFVKLMPNRRERHVRLLRGHVLRNRDAALSILATRRLPALCTIDRLAWSAGANFCENRAIARGSIVSRFALALFSAAQWLWATTICALVACIFAIAGYSIWAHLPHH